ncbi:MAG: hypothetical protein ACE14V_15170 [bacterium]
MKLRISLSIAIICCLVSQSGIAAQPADSLSIENFENAASLQPVPTAKHKAKPIEEFPADDKYFVTTDRGCNLSFTKKEYVVSGRYAAKFEVTSPELNPSRPAFFTFQPAVNDWSPYHTLSFYLFILPASQYPESTLLVQLQATEFDGISWQDTSQVRSYAFNVPTGRPFQVLLALRDIPFNQKIGKILVGVVQGAGTYYLDNFEIYQTILPPEIELFPPLFYPNKEIRIPQWKSIYCSQIPMQFPGVELRNEFYDRGTFMYDGRIPVLLYFQNSKPIAKKDTIKVTVSDDTGAILKRTTLTFEKTNLRRSIPISISGDRNLTVEYNKQQSQVLLKDLAAIIEKNYAVRVARKETKTPFNRGIISAYAGMLYTPEGEVDIKSTLARLEDLGVNAYTYLIWQKSEKELAALPAFCDQAAKLGIEIWVYLVPPSEAPLNQQAQIADRKYPPFDMDYQKWAEAIAQISVTHPNLTLWMIDDFDANLDYFTLDYVKQMYETSKQLNPKLLVGYCVYHNRLKKYVDAGYMPYTDALLWGYQDGYWLYPDAGISPATLPAEINEYYQVCKDKPIIPGIYFSRHSSWPKDRPTLNYLLQAMNIAYDQAGIVWVYTTPSPESPKYNLVKKYIQNRQLIKWKESF